MSPRRIRPHAAQRPGGRHSRREVLKGAVGAGGLLAAGSLTFPRTARGQATPSPAASPVAGVPAGLTAGVDYYPPPAPGVPEAFETFPTPFRTVEAPPASGGTVSIFQISFNPPIAPRGENQYWQEREQRLGLDELAVTFAPSDTYQDQLAALTAGGELADLMYVDLAAAPAHAEVFGQGAYTDLTPYVTGDALQEFPNLARFPDYMWRNSAINGVNYGVPRSTFTIGTWMNVRQDWAEQAGIPAPANAEELFNLLVAFTEGDPDGNGAANTYGLAAPEAGFGLPQFQQMFRVPNVWRQNDDGTLTHAVETDEYRQTIEYVRRLFEARVFHPDTPAQTAAQVSDAFVAGQVGATMGGRLSLPGGNGLRVATTEVQPNAVVEGLLMPGHDGGPPATWLGQGYIAVTCIPAAVGQDEERLRELLRILNFYAAPFGSEEHVFSFFGTEGVHSTTRPDGSRERTEGFMREILDFPNLVVYPPAYYFDRPGDAKYMQGLAQGYVANGIPDPTVGYYSEANIESGAEIGQLVTDSVTAIITGRESIDSLERMVNDWRSRGGDAIREEYQDLING